MSASPPDLEWVSRGAFSLTRSERFITARLPFFSDPFRKAAHNLRGVWNGKLNAWQFPLIKEASLLCALDRLSAAYPETLGAAAPAPDAEASLELAESLIKRFAEPAIVIVANADAGVFKATFSYHPALVSAVRECAGARWNKAFNRWEMPLTAANARRLNAINERADQARELYQKANAGSIAAERARPLAFEAQEGPFELSLAFDHTQLAYRLRSRLSLSEPLGVWAIMEPLTEAGILADPHSHGLLISPKLGRWGAKSVIVNAAQRDALAEALTAIRARLRSLGEPKPIELPRLPTFYTRSVAAPPELAGGDLLLEPNRARLLLPCSHREAVLISQAPPSGSNDEIKVKKKRLAWGFELSGSEAREWIARWGSFGEARCCWSSEIDLPGMKVYLEALEISDSLRTTQPAPQASAFRL